MALREGGELLWLAMADPTDQEALGVVKRRTQKRVRPAVAGPTEILRAVRTLYSAPTAGKDQREAVDADKLAAMEIENQTAASEYNQERFEVVNVADDIGGSAISRIARQLGVAVPANMPSRASRRAPLELTPSNTPAPPIETRTPKAISAIPPKTDPRAK